MHIEFLCISEVDAGKKDLLSFHIKASHLHIGPKWLCQPEIGYTTHHFFQNEHTHYCGSSSVNSGSGDNDGSEDGGWGGSDGGGGSNSNSDSDDGGGSLGGEKTTIN